MHAAAHSHCEQYKHVLTQLLQMPDIAVTLTDVTGWELTDVTATTHS